MNQIHHRTQTSLIATLGQQARVGSHPRLGTSGALGQYPSGFLGGILSIGAKHANLPCELGSSCQARSSRDQIGYGSINRGKHSVDP